MLRARLLALPLLGLSLLATRAMASSPEAAITRAAVAPFQDALRHDVVALCGDLVPAVAAGLVPGSAPAGDCPAAVSHVLALTAADEPPANPDLSVEPTVHDLEVGGQHATLRLSFTYVTTVQEPGTSIVAFHYGGPIKLELEEVAGVWLVSSRARIATVPGCHLPSPRRCRYGARVLQFSVGEKEPVQPDEQLLTVAVPERQGRAKREIEAGRDDVAQSGCLACHRIGDNGNAGPGPNLTHIGSKLSAPEIARALVNPRAPMPSFKNLPAQRFDDIVRFLASLR